MSSTTEIPPEFIQDSNEATSSSAQIPNPTYFDWIKQDKLISSWLLGSMNEDLLSQMLHCQMTKEIWSSLDCMFASRNLARVMQLKSKLENLKKGSTSLKDYFLKVKNLVDSLTAVGKRLLIDDHILHILAGLGLYFDSIVSVIVARKTPQTIQEVCTLLLQQKGRNERNLVNLDGSIPSVNLTVNDSNKKNTTSNSNFNNTPHYQRGRGNNRQSNRRNWNGNTKLQCQICGRFGHTALRCYI